MARCIPQPLSTSVFSPHHRTRLRIPSRWTSLSTACGRQFHATPCAADYSFGDRQFVRQPSPGAMMKKLHEQATKDILKQRDDLGLLPGTWVPHSGENRTQAYKLFYKKPKMWWKFYTTWLKVSAQIWQQTMMFRWDHFGFQLRPKNRPASKNTRPQKKEIVKAAEKLHSQMFTYFARGMPWKIKDICLGGIRTSLEKRVKDRAPKDLMEWNVKYDKVKLVNWRLLTEQLGESGGKPICLEQAVVRIQSTQTLRKGKLPRMATEDEASHYFDTGECTIPDTTWSKEIKHDDKVEYLVIQRKLEGFKPKKWKVWGFTHEITVDNFEEEIVKANDIEEMTKKQDPRANLQSRNEKQSKSSERKVLRPRMPQTAVA